MLAMELALFQEYARLSQPHLLHKGGVYVVQPNGMQKRLENVHKIGKGNLKERFRMYKQMWPDGGKVFAFFTTPTASTTEARPDLSYRREQQLLNESLRSKRYHGEWVDADLNRVVDAMKEVHKPSEGHFYLCDEDRIQRVEVKQMDEEVDEAVPRRVLPFRGAKAASTAAYFLSLGMRDKKIFVRQLPAEERNQLLKSLPVNEQVRHITTILATPSAFYPSVC